MSKRLTEHPKVTSVSDNTLFYAVDQDRPFGNQSVHIEKPDLKTDLDYNADEISDSSTTNKFTTQADKDRLANTSGTNTGDQDISGISTNTNNISSNSSSISTLNGKVTNLEENQYSGVIVYQTLADLPITGVVNTSYKVSNDPTYSNNGYYAWNGSAYIKDANLYNGEVAEGEVEAVTGDKINTAANNKIKNSLLKSINGISSFDSLYNGTTSKSVLDTPITLSSDGDYIEFTVTLQDWSSFQSMGIFGETGTGTSSIGFYTNGYLYVRDDANSWLSLNGIILGLPVGEENKIKLLYTGGNIKTYRNDVLQKTFTAGNIVISNIGNAYTFFNGKLRDIKISHSSGTILSIPSPYFSDDVVNTDVDYTPSKDGYLTPSQKDSISEIKTPIKVVGISSTEFHVHSITENNDYLVHEWLYSNRPDYSEQGWYSSRITHNDNQILQGNFNWIHVINNSGEGEHVGILHGCETFITSHFFIDGQEFDPTGITGQTLNGKEFSFNWSSVHYAADDVATTNGSQVIAQTPLIESTRHNMSGWIRGFNEIEYTHKLIALRDNTSFSKCYMAMLAGYYPYFNRVQIENVENTLNSMDAANSLQILSPSTALIKNKTFYDTSDNRRAELAHVATMWGTDYDYKVRQEVYNLDNSQQRKMHIQHAEITGQRSKLYWHPVITSTIASRSGETVDIFNDGDYIEGLVKRKITI